MRVRSFVRYLPDYGWIPKVLTVHKKYYDSTEGFLDYSLIKDINQSNVQRTSCFQPWSRLRSVRTEVSADSERNSRLRKVLKFIYEMVFIPDDKVFWIPNALLHIRHILRSEKIDAILATTPYHSTGLIGALANQLWDVPFVLDIRDDWIGNPLWWSGEYWHRKTLASILEKWMVKRASFVITVTKESQRFVQEKYPWKQRSSVVYIPNGFDPKDFEDGVQNEDPFHSGTQRSKIVYVGSLTHRRDPTTLFRAMNVLKRSNPDHLPELHFAGPMDARWLDKVQDLELTEDIHYHGSVEHERVVDFIKASSACLLFSPKEDGCDTVVPGKIYEYLAARKPILALTPSDSATAVLLESDSVGWVVDPQDVNGIERALMSIALGDYQQSQREWSDLSDFNRRLLVGKLADVLNKIASSKSG